MITPIGEIDQGLRSEPGISCANSRNYNLNMPESARSKMSKISSSKGSNQKQGSRAASEIAIERADAE